MIMIMIMEYKQLEQPCDQPVVSLRFGMLYQFSYVLLRCFCPKRKRNFHGKAEVVNATAAELSLHFFDLMSRV